MTDTSKPTTVPPRSTPDAYHPEAVEAKWQARWAERHTNEPDLDRAKRPFYNLMMFPYPSAEGLHVGNMFAFTGSDVYGRFKRLQGYDVFEPIGFDAFGIHSENYAIKLGINPAELIPQNIANFRRQLRRIGGMFDWRHELSTTDPRYYKWTQWIFLQLFKAGKAYKKAAAVNWCPNDKTVLANEQVIDGRCERCGTRGRAAHPGAVVLPDHRVRRPAAGQPGRQDEDGLVRHAPRPRSATGSAGPRGRRSSSRWTARWRRPTGTRTSRASASSPPGPTRSSAPPSWCWRRSIRWWTRSPRRSSGRRWRRTGRRRRRRTWSRARWATRRRPASSPAATPSIRRRASRIPVWIADYVLMEYGTGAIMAVPGHDERDFEFAQKFGLPIVRVVAEPGQDPKAPLESPYVDNESGLLVNSGQFDGMPVPEAKPRDHPPGSSPIGAGKGVVQYRLHDWCISRQRYWGPPIPIIYCDEHGAVPVPEKDLPVVLPLIEDFRPDDTGISPLARHEEWYYVPCPHCGKRSRRETDVTDTFLDSAWYHLRYPSTEFDDRPFDPARTKKWLPVHDLHRRQRARGAAPAVRALHHDGAARPGPAATSTSRTGSSGPTA